MTRRDPLTGGLFCMRCGRSDRNLHYLGREQTGCDGCRPPPSLDQFLRSPAEQFVAKDARPSMHDTRTSRWTRLKRFLCGLLRHRPELHHWYYRCSRCGKWLWAKQGWQTPERYR